MNILVINAGSSSLKYQLIDIKKEKVLAKGLYERIGDENSSLSFQADGEKKVIKKPAKDHLEAVEEILKTLTDKENGVISSVDEIDAVGHRVVHGGEQFSKPQMLTDVVMEALEENVSLAPLHNPANILGINACRQQMPDKFMVGVFDTAYHRTIPTKAFLYAIPFEAYEKYKIRRYGFHGISHNYVVDRIGQILGKSSDELRIINCHLGNGSSIAAIDRGKVVDTSMGFSPLEGLAMGTRSGDIDPTVIQYIMSKMDMSLDETMEYLNRKSGVLGVSGISSDFRDLMEAEKNGDEKAALAIALYCYRVKKYIGAYIAIMGDVDVISFTAGIGENAPAIRKRIIGKMPFLDTRLDEEKNNIFGEEAIISDDTSKVKIMVVPTNEEVMIARETYSVYKKEVLSK